MWLVFYFNSITSSLQTESRQVGPGHREIRSGEWYASGSTASHVIQQTVKHEEYQVSLVCRTWIAITEANGKANIQCWKFLQKDRHLYMNTSEILAKGYSLSMRVVRWSDWRSWADMKGGLGGVGGRMDRVLKHTSCIKILKN